eukprot:s2531_g10.t4
MLHYLLTFGVDLQVPSPRNWLCLQQDIHWERCAATMGRLSREAFNQFPVSQGIFGMPSMANGLDVQQLLVEVGKSLADADVKAQRVMSLSESQRVRMFTEKALDNIQHARELHAQVEDSVANVGIGMPREEQTLGLLLGHWRDSQGNSVQVTHDVAKGYQVLIQRPGQRRGRRFTAYRAEDGCVYCGRYMLDLDATGVEICWQQRSDRQQVSIWSPAAAFPPASLAEPTDPEECPSNASSRCCLQCPSCGERIAAKEGRTKLILPLFMAMAKHMAETHQLAELQSAKIRFASKILTKLESSLAVDIFMDHFLEEPWMLLCCCCLLLELDQPLWAQRLFHVNAKQTTALLCYISWPSASDLTSGSPWTPRLAQEIQIQTLEGNRRLGNVPGFDCFRYSHRFSKEGAQNSTAFKKIVHLLLESSASHVFVENLQSLRRECQKDPATCPSRASRFAWDWQLQLHRMQIKSSAAHPVVMSVVKKVECQIHSQVPIQELLQQAVCEATNLGCLYRLWETGPVIPAIPATFVASGVLAVAGAVGLLALDTFGPVKQDALRLPEEVTVHFVDTAEGLQLAMQQLSATKMIGLDCEHCGFGADAEISLMQLATFSHCFIIDVLTLARKELALCGPLLTMLSSKVLLAFDFRSDASLLEALGGSQHHLEPLDLRDGTGGLRHLVQRALTKELCKVEQCSCWGRRPLRASQLHYAALDAWVLLPCAKYLQDVACSDCPARTRKQKG